MFRQQPPISIVNAFVNIRFDLIQIFLCKIDVQQERHEALLSFLQPVIWFSGYQDHQWHRDEAGYRMAFRTPSYCFLLPLRFRCLFANASESFSAEDATDFLHYTVCPNRATPHGFHNKHRQSRSLMPHEPSPTRDQRIDETS